MLAEAIETTLHVIGVLTALGIRYVVGGSLASSLQGIPRATNDVDLVAAMQLEHAAPFVELRCQFTPARVAQNLAHGGHVACPCTHFPPLHVIVNAQHG